MRKIDLIFIDDDLKEPRIGIVKKRHNNDRIETHCFNESKHGLEFIKKSKNSIILVLDLKMRDHEMQGIEILKEVRKTRKKIPVIIKSGNNKVSNEEFRELINNNISHFIKKGNTKENNAKEKEYVIESTKYIMKNVPTALEEYISCRKDRKEVRIVSKSGKGIPLTELLDEVKQETEMGIDFEKAIYKMSIELLTHKDS